MKGLQHKVIEINDTNNTEIEKILVFLKPGDQHINVANTRAQAQELLNQITITKKRQKPPFALNKTTFKKQPMSFKKICLMTLGALALAVAIVVMIL